MKPKTLHLLFSHTLTPEQIEDAKTNWGVSAFAPLPKDLQRRFSNVPPELESLKAYAEPFKAYLKEEATEEDIVLIQGDFGLCFLLANYCKVHDLIPVYATTERIVQEKDGVKLSIFKHIRFRKYE